MENPNIIQFVMFFFSLMPKHCCAFIVCCFAVSKNENYFFFSANKNERKPQVNWLKLFCIILPIFTNTEPVWNFTFFLVFFFLVHHLFWSVFLEHTLPKFLFFSLFVYRVNYFYSASKRTSNWYWKTHTPKTSEFCNSWFWIKQNVHLKMFWNNQGRENKNSKKFEMNFRTVKKMWLKIFTRQKKNICRT